MYSEDQLHTAVINALLHPLCGAQRKKKVIQCVNRARKSLALPALESYDVKKIAVAVAKASGAAFTCVKGEGVESWKITSDAMELESEIEL